MNRNCLNWLVRGLRTAGFAATGFAAGCTGGPWALPGWRSHAIPDRYPLGAVERAHFHTMQTNGEAGDFILHQMDFVGDTAELNDDGRDRIQEIAARLQSTPFPVLVERSENNANPQLDAERRQMVALVLRDLGNPDADQRTYVATAYGRGNTSMESQIDYFRYIYSRGGFGGFTGGGNNGTNNSFGGFGGFGAAGGR
ncbi:MAG: hypothetical protein HY290_00155 [Planctomycetia bacterium]|nr:hypothetical protein [Planctomycetia bacterium]